MQRLTYDESKVVLINLNETNDNIINNHELYCKKHGYNYIILETKENFHKNEDKLNLVNNELENKYKNKFDTVMILCKNLIFTNLQYKIEDVVVEDKNIHYSDEVDSHVIIVNKLLSNNEIHYYKKNEMYCNYLDFKPEQFMLTFNNVPQSIQINDQVKSFNNLFETENNKPQIIISIATIPTRIVGLKLMVENLLSSICPPDKIVFTLPKQYKLFPDSNDHIPNIKELLKEYIDKNIVYINEMDVDNENNYDYGPCNKWLGIYKFLNDNPDIVKENFFVIVLDDDVFYRKNFFELLLKKHEQFKYHVITGYTSYSDYGNNLKVKIYKNNEKTPLLKGVNGHLLPKHFFINKINPDFKQTVNRGIQDRKSNDLVFQDDYIITTMVYYYKYSVKSVYNELVKLGFRTCYFHNKKNNDNKISFHGVSGRSERHWFNKNETYHFLRNFTKYYKY